MTNHRPHLPPRVHPVSDWASELVDRVTLDVLDTTSRAEMELQISFTPGETGRSESFFPVCVGMSSPSGSADFMTDINGTVWMVITQGGQTTSRPLDMTDRVESLVERCLSTLMACDGPRFPSTSH